jgi:hypothetical protein
VLQKRFPKSESIEEHLPQICGTSLSLEIAALLAGFPLDFAPGNLGLLLGTPK